MPRGSETWAEPWKGSGHGGVELKPRPKLSKESWLLGQHKRLSLSAPEEGGWGQPAPTAADSLSPRRQTFISKPISSATPLCRPPGWAGPWANYGLCKALGCSAFSQRWPCWLPLWWLWLRKWKWLHSLPSWRRLSCLILRLQPRPSWRRLQSSTSTRRGVECPGQPIPGKDASVSILSILIGLAYRGSPRKKAGLTDWEILVQTLTVQFG